MEYSAQDVANIAESEGLDYTIRHYLSPYNIEEGPVKDQAIKACNSMNRLEDLLPKPTEEDLV